MCETATIRCLSIRNPWATLIVNGIKDVENRAWSQQLLSPHGEWLLIHASSSLNTLNNNLMMMDIERKCGRLMSVVNMKRTCGHILGMMHVSSFVPSLTYKGQSIWAHYPKMENYLMTINTVWKFPKPIQMLGKLKLFHATVVVFEQIKKMLPDGSIIHFSFHFICHSSSSSYSSSSSFSITICLFFWKNEK